MALRNQYLTALGVTVWVQKFSPTVAFYHYSVNSLPNQTVGLICSVNDDAEQSLLEKILSAFDSTLSSGVLVEEGAFDRQKLICLGKQPAAYLQTLGIAHYEVMASLKEMLLEPMLKKNLWSVIRALQTL